MGDIHGRFDLLVELHQKIMEHSARHDGPHTIVFLGDYIDRGNQSKEVLDFLMAEPFGGFEHIFLKGNHEAMLLDCLKGDINITQAFLSNGGKKTFKSFKISGNRLYDDLPWCQRTFGPYMKWLTDLKLQHRTPEYLFVHAGINPLLSGDSDIQQEEHLLWIRDKFLLSNIDYGYIVVHGHTTTENDKPEVKHNRINVDTGAFWSGILTAVCLSEGEPEFLSTGDVENILTSKTKIDNILDG